MSEKKVGAKNKNKSKNKKNDSDTEEYEDDDLYEEEVEEEYGNDEYEEDDDDLGDLELSEDEKECEIEDAIEHDNTYFDNNEELKINESIHTKYVNKEDRLSSDRLTKYEMVRILGERITQLTKGALPLIKNYENLSYEKIAEEEFKLNMIPFNIVRRLPNGTIELWELNELTKDHLLL
jgi:DNA-directed RNA polymerase subunit K/omega